MSITLVFSVLWFILMSWILTEALTSSTAEELVAPSTVGILSVVFGIMVIALVGILNAMGIVSGLALAITAYVVWELFIRGLKEYGHMLFK